MQFRDEFFFLSNFYPVEMTWNGIQFHSAENLYQAMKSKKVENWIIISKMTAGQAKRHARGLEMDLSWEQDKVGVMKYVVGRKFKENPRLTQMLLDTKRKELTEDNYWHDNFWGRCLCDRCKDKSFKNTLGKILMELRDEITEKDDELD